MTLEQIKDKVRTKIKVSDKIITNDDIFDAISDAVWFYSEKNPHKRIKDETGDGSAFSWTPPNTWEDDWSHLEKVEYPAGESGERETQDLTEMDDYQVIRTATGTYEWRLIGHTPVTGDIVRFTYTSRHSITAGADGDNTIPGGDTSTPSNPTAGERSVIFAASYLAALMAASYYANHIPAGIQADLGDHTARVQQFINLANEFKAQSGLGDIIDSSEKAGAEVACVIKEFKTEPSWEGVGGGGWMTHRSDS